MHFRTWARKVMAASLGFLVVSTASNAAPDWKLVDLRAQLVDLSDALATDSQARTKSVASLAGTIDWPMRRTAEKPVPVFVEPKSPCTDRLDGPKVFACHFGASLWW